jgi:hypothetical protein
MGRELDEAIGFWLKELKYSMRFIPTQSNSSSEEVSFSLQSTILLKQGPRTDQHPHPCITAKGKMREDSQGLKLGRMSQNRRRDKAMSPSKKLPTSTQQV